PASLLASSAVIFLVYLALRTLLSRVSFPAWLDPVGSLGDLRAGGGAGWPTAFLIHLAAWAVVGTLCFVLVAGLLRWCCLRQQDSKPSRRLWAFRPAVADDSVRWRERYVIGLAPL